MEQYIPRNLAFLVEMILTSGFWIFVVSAVLVGALGAVVECALRPGRTLANAAIATWITGLAAVWIFWGVIGNPLWWPTVILFLPAGFIGGALVYYSYCAVQAVGRKRCDVGARS